MAKCLTACDLAVCLPATAPPTVALPLRSWFSVCRAVMARSLESIWAINCDSRVLAVANWPLRSLFLLLNSRFCCVRVSICLFSLSQQPTARAARASNIPLIPVRLMKPIGLSFLHETPAEWNAEW